MTGYIQKAPETETKALSPLVVTPGRRYRDTPKTEPPTKPSKRQRTHPPFLLNTNAYLESRRRRPLTASEQPPHPPHRPSKPQPLSPSCSSPRTARHRHAARPRPSSRPSASPSPSLLHFPSPPPLHHPPLGSIHHPDPYLHQPDRPPPPPPTLSTPPPAAPSPARAQTTRTTRPTPRDPDRRNR